MEKLEKENRSLCERLSDLELELTRKESSLKTANQRKSELLSDLRDSQCKVKELQTRLEKAESAELEAKGIAHEHRLALEAAEASLQEKINSSKAVMNSFELTIKNLKKKLAEKEDQYDNLAASLQVKEEMVQSLTSEKTRIEKENMSRMNNLSQALIQAKQTCTQLTEQNDAHKRKEWELAQKIEDLQQQKQQQTNTSSTLATRRSKISDILLQSSNSSSSTFTALPIETEVDSLLEENRKLKQDLACLQTNFELTSGKSKQLRNQTKDLETSVSELQSLLDKTIAEKEELQNQLDKLRDELKTRCGSEVPEKKKISELSQQVECLQEELDSLQREKADLQGKVKSEHEKALMNKNALEQMKTEKKALKDEKSAVEGEMKTLCGELEKLQEKCRELESSTESNTDSKRKNSAAIDVLQAKLAQLGKEKEDVSDRLTNTLEQLEEAQDKLHLQREEIRGLEVRLMGKEREVAVLSSNQGKSDYSSEVDMLRIRAIDLTEENEELNLKNEKYRAKCEQLEGMIAELNKSNGKLSRESKHGSELARKMTREMERLEEMIVSLEGELKTKTEQLSVVTRKHEDAKTALSERLGLLLKCEEKVRDFTAQANHLDKENFRLSIELAGSREKLSVSVESQANLEQKVSKLEAKLDAVEFSVLEKESCISDLKCAGELMEAENLTLLNQVTSLSEMVSTRNFKIETQQSQIAQHKAEVLEIVEQISELEHVHGNCAKTISKLENEISTLKESLERGGHSKSELQSKVSSLSNEVRELSMTNARLKATNSDLARTVELHSVDKEKLTERCNISEACVRKLEQELKSESLSLQAARDDFAHAMKSYDYDKREMNENVEKLTSRCLDLERKCDEYHREKVALKSYILDLQVEVREQVHLVSTMRRERDNLGEQYQILKESALSLIHSGDEDETIDARQHVIHDGGNTSNDAQQHVICSGVDLSIDAEQHVIHSDSNTSNDAQQHVTRSDGNTNIDAQQHVIHSDGNTNIDAQQHVIHSGADDKSNSARQHMSVEITVGEENVDPAPTKKLQSIKQPGSRKVLGLVQGTS